MYRLLLFVFSLTLLARAVAQPFNFKNYGTSEGLPSPAVYYAMQDSKGYLWFATENGVCKFDGVNFTNISRKFNLPEITIFQFYEDYQNRIWFTSFNGDLIYYKHDSIHTYKYNNIVKKLMEANRNITIPYFYVDSLENVFYSNRNFNVLYKIDKLGHLDTTIINSFIYDILPTPLQRTFFFVNDNFAIQTPHKNIRIPFFNDQTKSSHRSQIIKKNNTIVFSITNVLYRFTDTLCIQQKDLKQIIHSLHIDKLNNLWVGTENGVYCFKNMDLEKSIYYLLPNESVTSILQDRENGYWFTTLRKGIFYMPTIFMKSCTKENGLPDNEITSLLMEPQTNNVWLGMASNNIAKIKNNNISVYPFHNPPKEEVYDLAYNKTENNIWMLTSSKTYTIQKNNSQPNQYNIRQYSKPKLIATRNILNTSDSALLIGGLYHLHYIKKANIKSLRFTFAQEHCETLLEINKNSFLLGNKSGLWEYNQTKNTIHSLNKKYPVNCRVTCLTKTPDNKTIFIGTKNNGLFILHNDSLKQETINTGLSSNFITNVFYCNGVLWVGTSDNGVNKIEIGNNKAYILKINWLNSQNGLLSNEINDIVANDSMAYIATRKGLNVYEYTRDTPNNSPPPVYFTGISINGRDTLLHNTYSLPYNKNVIEVSFIGLTYKTFGKVKYKYSLQCDNDPKHWISTTTNSVKLAFLAPGKYNLTVKAINENGIESEKPASINIIILKPYFKTIGFIIAISLLIILIISGILYLVYRVKLKEINKRNQLEKNYITNNNRLLSEIQHLNQKALALQMNPHFIFNSLNSIQCFILNNDVVASNNYLSKFSRLMRRVLDISQNDLIPIHEEIEALDLYLSLEKMRLNDKFTYSISPDESLNTHSFKIPPLIIQPLVENAIWHGIVHLKEKGFIEIKFIDSGTFIICSIQDNGVGRKKSGEINSFKTGKHKSAGLGITERRFELMNEYYKKEMKVTIEDQLDINGESIGTKVELILSKLN